MNSFLTGLVVFKGVWEIGARARVWPAPGHPAPLWLLYPSSLVLVSSRRPIILLLRKVTVRTNKNYPYDVSHHIFGMRCVGYNVLDAMCWMRCEGVGMWDAGCEVRCVGCDVLEAMCGLRCVVDAMCGARCVGC